MVIGPNCVKLSTDINMWFTFTYQSKILCIKSTTVEVYLFGFKEKLQL